MLELTSDPAVLPAPGPVPLDLNAMLSPAQNLAHGYNIAEQTCFHKRTVNNLIISLNQISASYKGLVNLLHASTQLVDDSTQLATDTTTLVGRTTTLLREATTLVTAVAGLVTALIGFVSAIIGSLGAISTAALVAAFAAIAAGVLCALFWVPFAGYGLLAAGAIAIAALLAVVFFLIRGSIAAIMGSLTGVTGAIGTLTTPLTTLTGSLGSVTAILSNAALPSDVTRSLSNVQTSLATVQTRLSAELPLVNDTAVALDQRVTTLQDFLNPTPAGSPAVPRAHLEDTYRQAVRVYDQALNDLKLLIGPITKVGNYMLKDLNNAPQLNPGNPPSIDKTLRCPGVADPASLSSPVERGLKLKNEPPPGVGGQSQRTAARWTLGPRS